MATKEEVKKELVEYKYKLNFIETAQQRLPRLEAREQLLNPNSDFYKECPNQNRIGQLYKDLELVSDITKCKNGITIKKQLISDKKIPSIKEIDTAVENLDRANGAVKIQAAISDGESLISNFKKQQSLEKLNIVHSEDDDCWKEISDQQMHTFAKTMCKAGGLKPDAWKWNSIKQEYEKQ